MVTKRTIQAHLEQDQQFLQSLSAETKSAILVQSHITQMIQLLSQSHGGHELLATASDHDGSHSEGSKGALLNHNY